MVKVLSLGKISTYFFRKRKIFHFLCFLRFSLNVEIGSWHLLPLNPRNAFKLGVRISQIHIFLLKLLQNNDVGCKWSDEELFASLCMESGTEGNIFKSF